ncbi:MAG: aldo/keto reductase [Clostridia bacterium]|nr:aldo/keto reductase [Clostridia bacterium]
MLTKNFGFDSISRLGFGAMRLPVNEDNTINYNEASKLFDYAIKNGVNYFDTAFGYHNGKSAEFVGSCLSKYDRKSYFLANKMPPWEVNNPEDLERIFSKQLCDLKTDYIDFYLLHSLTDDNWKRFFEHGAYDFAWEKKRQGKVCHVGFSFHGSPHTLKELLEFGASRNGWDFIQIQFNYLDYFSANAKTEYDMITSYGIPIMVMEPVRGGKLANLPKSAQDILKSTAPDMTPAEWALRWVMDFDNVTVVLSGMSNRQQVEQNINTFCSHKPLTSVQKNALYEAANQIRRIKTIPCTSCGYCTESCPCDIKIPYIFERYNKYLEDKDLKGLKKDFEENCSEGHRSSDCISCNTCVEKCPQKISVPDVLALMPVIKKD